MDYQAMFNFGVTIIIAGVGWFAREMYGAVDSLRKDLYEFREKVATTYMPKQEIQMIREEIIGMLIRIENKIGK